MRVYQQNAEYQPLPGSRETAVQHQGYGGIWSNQRRIETPATAPAETPATAPAETPATAPAETPAEQPTAEAPIT